MPKIAPRSGDPIPATPKPPKPTIAELIRDAEYCGYLKIASSRRNFVEFDWMQSCKARRAPYLMIVTRSTTAAFELDMRPTGSNLGTTAAMLIRSVLAEHAKDVPNYHPELRVIRAVIDLQHAEFVTQRIVTLLERCEARP